MMRRAWPAAAPGALAGRPATPGHVPATPTGCILCHSGHPPKWGSSSAPARGAYASREARFRLPAQQLSEIGYVLAPGLASRPLNRGGGRGQDVYQATSWRQRAGQPFGPYPHHAYVAHQRPIHDRLTARQERPMLQHPRAQHRRQCLGGRRGRNALAHVLRRDCGSKVGSHADQLPHPGVGMRQPAAGKRLHGTVNRSSGDAACASPCARQPAGRWSSRSPASSRQSMEWCHSTTTNVLWYHPPMVLRGRVTWL
jgi:hypothetical protein